MPTTDCVAGLREHVHEIPRPQLITRMRAARPRAGAADSSRGSRRRTSCSPPRCPWAPASRNRRAPGARRGRDAVPAARVRADDSGWTFMNARDSEADPASMPDPTATAQGIVNPPVPLRVTADRHRTLQPAWNLLDLSTDANPVLQLRISAAGRRRRRGDGRAGAAARASPRSDSAHLPRRRLAAEADDQGVQRRARAGVLSPPARGRELPFDARVSAERLRARPAPRRQRLRRDQHAFRRADRPARVTRSRAGIGCRTFCRCTAAICSIRARAARRIGTRRCEPPCAGCSRQPTKSSASRAIPCGTSARSTACTGDVGLIPLGIERPPARVDRVARHASACRTTRSS